MKQEHKLGPSKSSMCAALASTEAIKDQLEKDPVNLTVGTLKRFLLHGHDNYLISHRQGDQKEAMYWDGYIRALYHVMEAREQEAA